MSQQPIRYADFGLFSYPTIYNHTFTSYRLYIKRTNLTQQSNAYKKNTYVSYKYRYEIIGISLSKYYNNPRNTWMTGVFVYINGNLMNPYPYTFNINKRETVLYWYETNEGYPKFNLTWQSSYYDPRL